MPSRSVEECRAIQEQIEKLTWVHRIELGDGIVTPGRWAPHPLILRAFDTIDFQGKKVLDIGCWDGLWSFEAEKRGAAEVYATDLVSQRSYKEQETFMLAHKALNSRVKYYPDLSVLDIERLLINDFEVVLFCGVFYHLRSPLLALSLLRRVMKENAVVVVEGDAVYGTSESYARFHYRDWHLEDASNWWVPSIECLRQWIESSFFEIKHSFSFPEDDSVWKAAKKCVKRVLGNDCTYVSRAVIVASAVSRKDPNYAFPDELLNAFDKNDYQV